MLQAQLNPAFRWADIPLDDEMGPRGYRETFVNKQGLKLASYWWPASNPRAAIVIIHGHGAYLMYHFGKFQGVSHHRVYNGSWIERWNDAGYSVCGIDIQSHGRSESASHVRCYFHRFDDLVDDMELFITGEVAHRKDFRKLPLFVCGISMGGCIAVNLCHRLWGVENLKGTVLLAPMLTLDRVSRSWVNQLMRPLSILLNVLVPTWALVAGKANEKFPEMQLAWESDPYTASHPTRVRVACEYLEITRRTVAAMPDMKFDFIAFHSEDDGLCDPDGSKQLFAASKADTKMLSIVNQFWHNLTEEEGNEALVNATISWMDTMIEQGGGAS